MKVMGVVVDTAKTTVRLVVTDGPENGDIISDFFELTFGSDDTPTSLSDLYKAVASRLRSHSVARVLIRRADPPARATGLKQGTVTRLLVEGAVVAAARSEVLDTILVTGRETAARLGFSKEELADRARTTCRAHGKQMYWTEAVGAALAARAD